MIGLGTRPGRVRPHPKGDRAVGLSNQKCRHLAIVGLLPSLDCKGCKIAKAGKQVRISSRTAKVERHVQQSDDDDGEVHTRNVRSSPCSHFSNFSRTSLFQRAVSVLGTLGTARKAAATVPKMILSPSRSGWMA